MAEDGDRTLKHKGLGCDVGAARAAGDGDRTLECGGEGALEGRAGDGDRTLEHARRTLEHARRLEDSKNHRNSSKNQKNPKSHSGFYRMSKIEPKICLLVPSNP